MSDRAAFLKRIRRRPFDCTVRLVFADWLDEFGASDLDRATAEFIRVSCRAVKTRTGRMPVAAYPWLAANWRRLIPSFWPEAEQHGATGGCYQCHAGATLSVQGQQMPVEFDFTFRRGFLDTCSANGPPELAPLAVRLWRLISEDQPLAKHQARLGYAVVTVIENGVPVNRPFLPIRLPLIRWARSPR